MSLLASYNKSNKTPFPCSFSCTGRIYNQRMTVVGKNTSSSMLSLKTLMQWACKDIHRHHRHALLYRQAAACIIFEKLVSFWFLSRPVSKAVIIYNIIFLLHHHLIMLCMEYGLLDYQIFANTQKIQQNVHVIMWSHDNCDPKRRLLFWKLSHILIWWAVAVLNKCADCSTHRHIYVDAASAAPPSCCDTLTCLPYWSRQDWPANK